MERIFTKAVGKRFPKGSVHDFPQATWEGIARSANEALDDFSQPLTREPMAMVEGRKAKSPPQRAAGA
jgi:hypothetical protein